MLSFLLAGIASPIGRYALIVVATVGVLFGAYYAGKSAGKHEERVAQAEATARAARERVNVETDIGRRPDAERDGLLNDWRRR